MSYRKIIIIFVLLIPFSNLKSERIWFQLNNKDDEFVMLATRNPDDFIDIAGEWLPTLFLKLTDRTVFSIHSFAQKNDNQRYEISYSLALLDNDGFLIEESIVTITRFSSLNQKKIGIMVDNIIFNKTDKGFSIKVLDQHDDLILQYYLFINNHFKWFNENIEIGVNTAFELKENYDVLTSSGIIKKDNYNKNLESKVKGQRVIDL